MTRPPARADLPLVELVDRLLERGVVLTGSARIAVAGVDLIELRLNLLVAAVDALAENTEAA